MDDPSPDLQWWLALAGAALLHAFTAFAKVAFRLAGPVTVEALVERVGARRTKFLRKSLGSPSAFWFSLHLAASGTFLLLALVLLGGGASLSLAGWVFEIRPTGRLLNDGLLLVVLLAGQALVEFILPVIASRLDRVAFLERTLPLLRAIHVLFSPLSGPLARLVENDDEEDDDEEVADEDLDAYIGVGTREGILEEAEGELLRNLVEFGDTRVYEVMTPRTDIVGIDAGRSVEDVVELVAERKHSRIPVHRGHLDDIVGVVTVKDAVAALPSNQGADPVTTIMRSPSIVPESKKVAELLKELQAGRQQMAIVVDEYGGTAGLVTVEDLLEELVGEIREEHEDAEGEDVAPDGEGGWLVKGRTSLHDLGQALGADLETDDTATVAGLLMTLVERVPEPGESVEKAGYVFEVVQADQRRVQLVRVRSAPSPEAASEAHDGSSA